MRIPKLATLGLAFLAAVAATGADNDGWIALFDGRTLQGWDAPARPADVEKNYWSVQDGTITCDSRGRRKHDYVWLLSNQEFTDFDLKMKIRSFRESGGNSGVQVRSRYDVASSWLDGPQVDVHPPGPYRTGLIYDDNRRRAALDIPGVAGLADPTGAGSQDLEVETLG